MTQAPSQYISNTQFTDPKIRELLGLAKVIASCALKNQDDMAVYTSQSTGSECPKLAVARAFQQNKSDKDGIIPKPKAEYYPKQIVLTVAYTKMKEDFIAETSNIVKLPMTRIFANNNIGGTENPGLQAQGNTIVRKLYPEIAEPKNVISLAEGRKRLRSA